MKELKDYIKVANPSDVFQCQGNLTVENINVKEIEDFEMQLEVLNNTLCAMSREDISSIQGQPYVRKRSILLIASQLMEGAKFI